MTLNPNKYKAAVPTILKLWDILKVKPDIHDIINDIGLSTAIEFAAVCMILKAERPDPRLEEITKTLIAFFKYDTIVEYVPSDEMSTPS